MDQASIHDEIKKLRKEVRPMNKALEDLKSDTEGIHQALSIGLQKLFSELEKLKIENHKIKSNLKYLMKARTSVSGETSFFSDSDVRSSSWMYSSRESLGPRHHIAPGLWQSPKGRRYTTDESSDEPGDSDDGKLMPDIVEEDGNRKGRNKKYQNKLNPRPMKSSDSDSTRSSMAHSQKRSKTADSKHNMEAGQVKVVGQMQNVRISNVFDNTSSSIGTSDSISSSLSRKSDTSNGLPSESSQSESRQSQSESRPSRNENRSSQSDIGASSTETLRSNVVGAAGGFDDGYDSDELDTNIEMEVPTKCQVIYPHTIEGYQPIMVPYDQIKFDDPKMYLRSLGFIMIDLQLEEFMYRMATLDNKKNEQLPKGLYTVLLMDTSYSIGPGGMYEVRKFVDDFLNEIEAATEYNLEEMVCMFEMGSHNGVLHEFTNDYSLLRESLDKVDKCAGRTNLWSSLIGLFCYLHKKAKKCVINGKTHGIRIVWVSDGNVTDDMHVLSNSEHEADLERVQDRILKFMPYLLREKMVLSAVEVGMDSEPPFLERFVKKGKGQYGHALWGKHVGRYYLYQHIIGKMLPDLRDPQNRGKMKEVIQKHTAEFEDFGKTDIAEISSLLKDKYKFTVPDELLEREPLPEYDDDQRINLYTTHLFPRIPPLGTRVAPGPKFKDRHREYTQGTVVAHYCHNTVVVKWDEEIPQPKIYFYIYETENHEVDVIYEYRKPSMSVPGDIGTGCLVKRGVSWERGNEDGGQNQVGVVVRKHAGKMVTVKWPNGRRARYRFGADGFYDLETVQQEEVIEYTDEKDRQKKIRAKEKVPQWEFQDEHNVWRTLDEKGNFAVMNFLDLKNGDKTERAETIFFGEILFFYLDTMKYEVKGKEHLKGDIRCVDITVVEQEKRYDIELNKFWAKRKSDQRKGLGGMGGILGNGGSDPNDPELNGSGQFGGSMGPGVGNLAGMFGQGGQGGGNLAGMFGQGGQGGGNLAGMFGQGGQGGGDLAGMFGQGGGNPMYGQGGQLGALLGQSGLSPDQQEKLATILRQPGGREQLAALLNQGQDGQMLAALLGQGGGNPMQSMMGGGSGMGGMGQMYGGPQGMMGQGGYGGMFPQAGPKWNCAACTLENGPGTSACSACGTARSN